MLIAKDESSSKFGAGKNGQTPGDGNAVVWRLGQLPSAGSFLIRLTAIPRRGGTVTNHHALTFGLLSRQSCVQVVPVEGEACDVPARVGGVLAAGGDVSLTVSGQAGCHGWVEVSTDLRRWDPVQPFSLDGQGNARLPLGVGAGSHRFYRVRTE